jgi:hypothetical protein
MAERRKYTRRDLMFYSRVVDAKTGRMVGNLLNITPEGAMVLSDRQVSSGIAMELHIELPEEISPKPELVFHAVSLWCQPDINPEFFDVGFQFQDVSDEKAEVVQRLVKEYGFRDRPNLGDLGSA